MVTKAESLSSIIDEVDPSIVVLCETKASNTFVDTFFKKLQYNACVKPDSGGRGLVVAVKNSFGSPLNVSSSPLPGIISAQLKFRNINARVIAAYGPQESTPAEDRKNFFDDLGIEVENAGIAGDIPMLIGDLNSKIDKQNDQLVACSPNGELLVNLVSQNDLAAVNHYPGCRGKWTRENRMNDDEKSVLDYVFVPHVLYETISEAWIDEELLFTPFYTKGNKRSQTIQYTDHNSIYVNFKINLIPKQNKIDKNMGWKITEKGLEKFKEVTEEG